MEKYILKLQILGILFVSILGTILHFLFAWSGYFYPIGVIAAVNESVWEHLKLPFYPILIFALIEYKFIKRYAYNFILAIAVASYIAPVFIIIIFYSYTAILGTNLLFIDILSFLIAIVISYHISYKILISKQFPNYVSKISLIAIIFLTSLFVIFTYYPPHFPIFQDSQTGMYGIMEHSH